MLEKFIEDYSERAFQFAFRLCGSTEQAKELVQEAFFRVLKSWKRYDAALPLENWYLKILRNIYYDGLKKHEYKHSISLSVPLSCDETLTLADVLADKREEPVGAAFERQETMREVKSVLDCLNCEHKAILALCDMQGLSYEQIAIALHCPLGTVRSRVNRARTAFKKAMSVRMTAGEVA